MRQSHSVLTVSVLNFKNTTFINVQFTFDAISKPLFFTKPITYLEGNVYEKTAKTLQLLGEMDMNIPVSETDNLTFNAKFEGGPKVYDFEILEDGSILLLNR